MSEYEEALKNYRYLQGQIKAIMPLDELKGLIADYERAAQEVASHRSRQFVWTAQQIAACNGNTELIGAILRQFAERIVHEARIVGIKSRDTDEEIIDQIVVEREEEKSE